MSDITQYAVPYRQKGVANGVATLDGSGWVPVSQIPPGIASGLKFVGVWDANANAPILTNGGGGGVQGDLRRVSVAGTTLIDGENDWKVGDYIVNDGTLWYKWDNSDNQTATETPFTPNGDITSTDTQAAVVEVRDDTDTKLTGKAPLVHTHTHASTTGQTANDHHAQSHAHDGVDGSGTVAHSATTGQTADDHHPQLHGATHSEGGGDDVEVEDLSTTGAEGTVPVGQSGLLAGTLAMDEIVVPVNFNIAGSGVAGAQTGYWGQTGVYVARTAAEHRFPKGRICAIAINVTTNTLNSASVFEVLNSGVATGVQLTVPALTTGTVYAAIAAPAYQVIAGSFLCVRGILGGTGGQAIFVKDLHVDFRGV